MKTKAFPTGRYRSVNMMVYFCRYRYFWFITSILVQLRADFDIRINSYYILFSKFSKFSLEF